MKKVICLLLILCAVASLTACGNDTNPGGTAETQQPAESDALENKPSDERLGTFDKSASLDETVMVDEGGVKITAAGLKYTDYSVELELTIENNSGKDLSFVSGSVGYNCNSINGYMVTDGYLNCDVADGKKANDSINFSYDGRECKIKCVS